MGWTSNYQAEIIAEHLQGDQLEALNILFDEYTGNFFIFALGRGQQHFFIGAGSCHPSSFNAQ